MARNVGIGASLSLAIWIGVWTTAPARGIELEPGQTYPAGTALTSATAGLVLTVPADWSAAWPAGSELLVMARSDRQAYVFLAADELSEAEALTQMSLPIDLGDGVVLYPKSPSPARSQGMWTADFDVTGTETPTRAVVWTRLGPHGIGVALIGLDVVGSESAGADAHRIAQTLAKQIQFKAPVSPRAAPASGEGDLPWQDYMRGRYIARYYTGSGYSEKTELWLCSDGRFQRSADAGGSSMEGASGAFAGRRAGRWTAHGSQPASGELVLEDEQGRSSHSLSLQSGKLFVDGSQWLRGENSLCP